MCPCQVFLTPTVFQFPDSTFRSTRLTNFARVFSCQSPGVFGIFSVSGIDRHPLLGELFVEFSDISPIRAALFAHCSSAHSSFTRHRLACTLRSLSCSRACMAYRSRVIDLIARCTQAACVISLIRPCGLLPKPEPSAGSLALPRGHAAPFHCKQPAPSRSTLRAIRLSNSIDCFYE